MYHLSIFSIIRNGAHYVDRYFEQVNAVTNYFKAVHVTLVTGDNHDDTQERLEAWLQRTRAQVKIYRHDTGAPTSYETMADRWQQLEHNWNLCLDDLATTQYAVCVESDLIWQPDVLLACVAALDTYDVVSPMLYAVGENRFYDINGFRLPDGRHFNPTDPIIPDWNGGRYVPLQTGGGMVVTRGDTLKYASWKNECRLHFMYGTRWVADTQLRIDHP